MESKLVKRKKKWGERKKTSQQGSVSRELDRITLLGDTCRSGSTTTNIFKAVISIPRSGKVSSLMDLGARCHRVGYTDYLAARCRTD